VKDPDGYLLELIEYHEGMPAGVPDPKASTRD
jgi:lactoylglutathione lyase